LRSGFLTEPERKAMESVVSPHGKYWLPIHWTFQLIREARQTGHITSDRAVEMIEDVSLLYFGGKNCTIEENSSLNSCPELTQFL
jgi:hypothetical protein